MSTDPSVSGSVARTKEQVEKAPLPDDSKERILRIFDKAAAATNGSPDKVQALTEIMLENTLLQAQERATEAVRVAIQVDGLIKEHIARCAFRQEVPSLPPWLASIYAFRWSITIVATAAILTGHAPEIIKTLFVVFK